MRITWTSHERREVALECLRLEALGKLPFTTLISQAQMVLPPERRRTITSSQTVDWLSYEKMNAQAFVRAEQEKQERITKTAPHHVPTPASKTQMSQSELDQVVEKLLEKLPDLLLDKLAERLMKRGVQAEAPVTPLASPVLEKSPEKEKLKKVLVIGPLPQQAHSLEEEFDGLLSLKFWKDEGPKRLKDLCRHSDAVVLMIDKMSHSVHHAVNKFAGTTAKVIPANGGVVGLKAAIERYFIEEA